MRANFFICVLSFIILVVRGGASWHAEETDSEQNIEKSENHNSSVHFPIKNERKRNSDTPENSSAADSAVPKIPCNEDQKSDKHGCMEHGQCIVEKHNNLEKTVCMCNDGYHGSNCEMQYTGIVRKPIGKGTKTTTKITTDRPKPRPPDYFSTTSIPRRNLSSTSIPTLSTHSNTTSVNQIEWINTKTTETPTETPVFGLSSTSKTPSFILSTKTTTLERTTKKPAQVQTTKRPTLVQTTKRPTLVQTTKKPTLVQTTKKPAFVKTTEKPASVASTPMPNEPNMQHKQQVYDSIPDDGANPVGKRASQAAVPVLVLIIFLLLAVISFFIIRWKRNRPIIVVRNELEIPLNDRQELRV